MSQFRMALAISTTMFGQYTDSRALYRSLLAPWCIWRSLMTPTRKPFEMTTRDSMTIIPSSTSMARRSLKLQYWRRVGSKLVLSFGNPARMRSRSCSISTSTAATDLIFFEDWVKHFDVGSIDRGDQGGSRGEGRGTFG